jgi:hypothetical protein
MESQRTAIDWLLDSDPAIRWQAMRDLLDMPPDTVSAKRARVAKEGWGAFLLARLRPGGDDRDDTRAQRDWVTLETLQLLRAIGLDPQSAEAREAVERVRDEVKWQGVLPQDEEWHGNAFFVGEVEPCINGRVVAVGAYFRQDVSGIVERVLGEQMADGGWNCEDDNGSTVGSFATTINVLEGLLEYENAGRANSDLTNARLRGQEYLVERGMYRRKSTGEIAHPDFLKFAFPPGYRYDVLRGLDYLRAARASADDRLTDAIEQVRAKRIAEGKWPRDVVYENHLDFEMENGEGAPSRWNTLRALRVLRWAEHG